MAVSTTEITVRSRHNATVYASFNFTTTGTSEVIDCTEIPVSRFSFQGTSGGSPTLWTAVLEGSIDGANFDNILTNTNVIGLLTIQTNTFSTIRYFRVRVTVLTLLLAPSINFNVLGVV